MKQIEPFNFASPFNYSQVATPQGCHSATLPSGSRTTKHIKQGLPKSAHDLGSPYFKPFSATFAPEKAFSIVSKSVGTSILLVERERMYINFVNREVEKTQRDISSDVPDTGENGGGEIYQAIAYVEKGREDELKRILPNCRITRWNNRAVDIISREGGKAEGIKQYLKENNILPQETMAFGDGENDIEMLECAGIGIAMGNAEDTVKKSADYVTDSVDDDGIEKALRRFQII